MILLNLYTIQKLLNNNFAFLFRKRERGMRVGFFSEFSKALNGESAGDRFAIKGKVLTCGHCEGDRFYKRSGDAHSRPMDPYTLYGHETVFECVNCGHLEWFNSRWGKEAEEQ